MPCRTTALMVARVRNRAVTRADRPRRLPRGRWRQVHPHWHLPSRWLARAGAEVGASTRPDMEVTSAVVVAPHGHRRRRLDGAWPRQTTRQSPLPVPLPPLARAAAVTAVSPRRRRPRPPGPRREGRPWTMACQCVRTCMWGAMLVVGGCLAPRRGLLPHTTMAAVKAMVVVRMQASTWHPRLTCQRCDARTTLERLCLMRASRMLWVLSHSGRSTPSRHARRR